MLLKACAGHGGGSWHIARWELFPHHRHCRRRRSVLLHGHQTAKRNILVSRILEYSRIKHFTENYYFQFLFLRRGPDGKTMSSEDHLHTRLVNRQTKYIFLPPTGVTTWAKRAWKLDRWAQRHNCFRSALLNITNVDIWDDGKYEFRCAESDGDSIR